MSATQGLRDPLWVHELAQDSQCVLRICDLNLVSGAFIKEMRSYVPQRVRDPWDADCDNSFDNLWEVIFQNPHADLVLHNSLNVEVAQTEFAQISNDREVHDRPAAKAGSFFQGLHNAGDRVDLVLYQELCWNLLQEIHAAKAHPVPVDGITVQVLAQHSSRRPATVNLSVKPVVPGVHPKTELIARLSTPPHGFLVHLCRVI
mmetsp:Transcript_104807/g.146102  ORF Transcript_104807/g.146102 Transcript_104807/m.146102 type:complete len:203 (+) Transcript_104807:332-940(+)